MWRHLQFTVTWEIDFDTQNILSIYEIILEKIPQQAFSKTPQ